MKTIKYLVPFMAVLILGCGGGDTPIQTNNSPDTKSDPASGKTLNNEELRLVEKNVQKTIQQQKINTKSEDIGQPLSDKELNSLDKDIQKSINEQNNNTNNDIGQPLSKEEEEELKKSL